MAFRVGRENKGCAEARDEPWTDVFVASIDGRRLSRFNEIQRGERQAGDKGEGSVAMFSRCARPPLTGVKGVEVTSSPACFHVK